MLPGLPGLEVLRRLRAAGRDDPHPDPVGQGPRRGPGQGSGDWAPTTTSSSRSRSTSCARACGRSFGGAISRRTSGCAVGPLEIDTAGRRVFREGEPVAPDPQRVLPARVPRLSARPGSVPGSAPRASLPQRHGGVEQRHRGPGLGPEKEDPPPRASRRSSIRGAASATSSRPPEK